MRLDREKQKAVIAYALTEGRSRLWLRCFLFLVDREAYVKLGASITGATYRKGKRGPIVEGLARSLRELEADGSIERGRSA